MGRAKFPKALSKASLPQLQELVFDEQQNIDIADTLGMNGYLSPDVEKILLDYSSRFIQTRTGHSSTTIENIRHTLRVVISDDTKLFKTAVEKLSFGKIGVESNGMDYITDEIMRPIATAYLADDRNKSLLQEKATIRLAQLEGVRIEHQVEPLKFFCGILKAIFETFAIRRNINNFDYARRKFAKTILRIVGEDIKKFDKNAKRIDNYLNTDVSILAKKR